MKKPTQSFYLWTIGTLTVAFALLAIFEATSSPGPGEVSSILHGVFIIIGASISGFLALLWLLVLLWKKRMVRYSILVVLLLVMAIPVISVLLDTVRVLKYQQEVKRRNNEIASVATDYIGRMKSIEGTATEKIQLRLAFDEEIRTRGLYTGLQSAATNQFHWLHNLYIWVLIDETYRPDQLTGVIDIPDSAGCKQFQSEFKSMLSIKKQLQILSSYCNPIPHSPD